MFSLVLMDSWIVMNWPQTEVTCNRPSQFSDKRDRLSAGCFRKGVGHSRIIAPPCLDSSFLNWLTCSLFEKQWPSGVFALSFSPFQNTKHFPCGGCGGNESHPSLSQAGLQVEQICVGIRSRSMPTCFPIRSTPADGRMGFPHSGQDMTPMLASELFSKHTVWSKRVFSLLEVSFDRGRTGTRRATTVAFGQLLKSIKWQDCLNSTHQ